MLRKLRVTKAEGFTLIELMIVIAIIGILAAIAIPNFISYRNKTYCTRAESDANSIASGLSDYFSIPSHTALPVAGPVGIGVDAVVRNISGDNTATITGTVTNIAINVTDVSTRCPTDYRTAMVGTATTDGWVGSVYTKRMIE